MVNLASYNTTAEQILEDTNVMRAIMRRALAQPTALNWKIVRGLSLYAGSKQVIAVRDCVSRHTRSILIERSGECRRCRETLG